MTKISEEIIFPGEASPCIFDPNLYEDDCDPAPVIPRAGNSHALWVVLGVVSAFAFMVGLIVGLAVK